MTRAKISEYSATANDNTDVNGINIAEGCPPSSMNNMGREIMAALKRFQVGSDGDGVTVGGSLVVSGSTTANTLTATVLNATTIDTTNIEVTNIKAKDGTASVSIADSTGIPTISKATVISTTDNTNAALRITQLGTGNALLVEDTTNPDATPFVIDANGRAIAGGLSTYSVNTITARVQAQSTSVFDGGFTTFLFANDGNPTFIGLAKSRGATLGTQTVVNTGDSLGTLQFSGSDGTAFIEAARITAAVDGTPGTNDMPGRLVFSTTADGASTPTERMRITQDGYVRLSSNSLGIQFGGDTAAANALDDYEEGTFTPTINQGLSSITYSSQLGFYTKVGRLVNFNLRISLSAGTGAGDIIIFEGLPFTSLNVSNTYFSGAFFNYVNSSFSNSTSTNLPTLYIQPNGTRVEFYKTNSNNFLGTDLATASTFTVHMSGFYFTA